MIYSINNSADLTVIGRQPQVEITDPSPNAEEVRKARFSLGNGKMPFKPSMYYLDLLHRAKFTDFLDSSWVSTSNAMLISEKFYEFLQNFRLAEYEFIPVVVTKRTKTWNAFLLHFYEYQDYLIDFPKSKFYKENRSRKVELLSEPFGNFEAYQRLSQQLREGPEEMYGLILSYEMYFVQEPTFDLFRIGTPRFGLYVSEKLKNAIESHGFTGIKFEEAHGWKKDVYDTSVPYPYLKLT